MMPPLQFSGKSQFSRILLKIDINSLETSSESFKKSFEYCLGVLI